MADTWSAAIQIIRGSGDMLPTNLLLSIIVVTYAAAGAGLAFRKHPRQIVSSAIKLPLLPLIITAVCLPALMMMAAVLELDIPHRLLLSHLLYVQAFQGIFVLSFVPVILFFSTGSGYDFMKLLNVLIFLVGGLVSLDRFLELLQEATNGAGVLLFVCWALLYAFVGCQTAWMLRPLIGSPTEPFVWRRRSNELNFYGAILLSVRHLLQARNLGRNRCRDAHQA